MEQSGVLARPITSRSCGSNPTPAIMIARQNLIEYRTEEGDFIRVVTGEKNLRGTGFFGEEQREFREDSTDIYEGQFLVRSYCEDMALSEGEIRILVPFLQRAKSEGLCAEELGMMVDGILASYSERLRDI
jgi:hypothetical protein